MSLSKVIEIARADLGYTEDSANSNLAKYDNKFVRVRLYELY